MDKKRIFIVEDETSIADNVVYALESEGFGTIWHSIGQTAVDELKQTGADLVILDVGLPDQSGFEVCKSIRQFSEIPIIFLTARGEEIDRVVGLEIGGDDYVVKPFSPRELVARVKVVLKRVQPALPKHEVPLFEIDEAKRQIYYQGNVLDLTLYEYGILVLLLSQPERVFTREQLMDKVWSEPEERFDRVVDTHIKTIRAKLKQLNQDDESIVTHRGVGYAIKET